MRHWVSNITAVLSLACALGAAAGCVRSSQTADFLTLTSDGGTRLRSLVSACSGIHYRDTHDANGFAKPVGWAVQSMPFPRAALGSEREIPSHRRWSVFGVQYFAGNLAIGSEAAMPFSAVVMPYGWIMLAACAFPVWHGVYLVRYWRRRHRIVRGCCTGCGYDLRGSVGCCPECGTAVESRRTAAA